MGRQIEPTYSSNKLCLELEGTAGETKVEGMSQKGRVQLQPRASLDNECAAYMQNTSCLSLPC